MNADFFSFSLCADGVKAEERQKLAKERREERAKYLGKDSRDQVSRVGS